MIAGEKRGWKDGRAQDEGMEVAKRLEMQRYTHYIHTLGSVSRT